MPARYTLTVNCSKCGHRVEYTRSEQSLAISAGRDHYYRCNNCGEIRHSPSKDVKVVRASDGDQSLLF